MKANVIEDAKVLIPNKDHKNFTETEEVIEKGTVLEGKETFINGLRRGQPFTYKLFVTKNGKFIYLNKVECMKNTVEVLMNADGKQEVKINTESPKSDDKKTLYMVVGATMGAAVGLGIIAISKRKYSNYQKAAIIGAGIITGACSQAVMYKLCIKNKK